MESGPGLKERIPGSSVPLDLYMEDSLKLKGLGVEKTGELLP